MPSTLDLNIRQLLRPQRIASKKINCILTSPPRHVYTVMIIGTNGNGILQECNPYMPCEIPTDELAIADVSFVMVNDSDKEIKSIVLADKDTQQSKEFIKGEDPYIFAAHIEPSRDLVKISEDRLKYEEFKKKVQSETLIGVSVVAALLTLFGHKDYSIGFGAGSALGFMYLSQLVSQIDVIENKESSIAIGSLRFLTLATTLGLVFSKFSANILNEPELILFGLLGFSMFRIIALTREYE